MSSFTQPQDLTQRGKASESESEHESESENESGSEKDCEQACMQESTDHLKA